MPLNQRFARVTVSCVFAAAAVLSLGAFSPAPPSGAPGTSSASPSWNPIPQPGGLAPGAVAPRPGAVTPRRVEMAPPPRPTVRALTAGEIRRRGLDRYIDMSRQAETSPVIIDTDRGRFTSSLLAPSRRPLNGASGNLATGCWYLTTTYGSPSFGGSGYHTWCGDGIRITYTSAGCTGVASHPTYLYEGCQNVQAYGVGWSVWDVTDGWRFCTSYNPFTGICSSRIYPWQKNRYGANGQVWLLGWGN